MPRNSRAHRIALAEADKAAAQSPISVRARRFREIPAPAGAIMTSIPIDTKDGTSPGSRGSALTAAAQIIQNNTTKDDLLDKRKRVPVQHWQNEAWALRDETGEMRFIGDRQARGCGQVRLYIGKRAKDSTGQPDPVVDGMVGNLSSALFGDTAASGQAMQRAAQQIIYSGEAFQRVRQLGPEDWEWDSHSGDEISGGTAGSAIKLNDGINPRTLEAAEIVARAWTPHPKLGSMADAPVRAILPIARELKALTQYIGAQIDSRLAGAGVLLLPEGIQSAFGQIAGPDGRPISIGDQMTDYFIRPLTDPGTAASVVPYMLIVPPELVDKIKHLSFASVLDPKAHELRDELIRRIGLGMDSDPSVLLGVGQASHWSAFAIGEDEVRLGISPICATVCHSLTVGFLRPLLQSARMADARDYTVWFDATPLELRPDRSQDALALYDKGEISLEALLRETGFSTTDAPTDDEKQAMVLQRLLFAAPMSPFAGQILERMGIKLAPVPGGVVAIGGDNTPPEETTTDDKVPAPNGPPPRPDGPPPGATDTSADDPARKVGAIAASAAEDHDTDGMVALLPTEADQQRLAIGNVPADEVHLTLAYMPDVDEAADPHAIAALFVDQSTGALTGDVNGEGILGGGSAAVWLANVLGLTDRRNRLVELMDAGDYPDVSHDFDGFTAHLTYETKGDHSPADKGGGDAVTLAGRPDLFGPVTFDRLRVALRGEYTDIALGEQAIDVEAPE